MLDYNEKKIITIIRYAPLGLILFISTIVIFYLYTILDNRHIRDINNLKEEVLESTKKELVQKLSILDNYLNYEKKQSEENLKLEIKSKVYEAHSIATAIYNKYKNKKNNKDIIDEIKLVLKDIRFFDGRGYFFIDDINGVKLLQPLNPELEGKNLINFEDAKGYKFVQTIVETIKNKTERFDSYYWYKDGNKNFVDKKISFYKTFEPLNIIVGAGEFLNDFEIKVKNYILEYFKKLSFENTNTINIIDYEGNFLSNDTRLVKNGYNLKDLNGNYFIRDIINSAKNEKYFVITKDKNIMKDGEYIEKIYYAKAIKDWNWIIYVNSYTNFFDNQILKRKNEIDEQKRENLKVIILSAVLITIIMLIISSYISKIIENSFFGYKKKITEDAIDLNKKDSILFHQSKMASMGEMLENIAHQWRQPLSAITTAATGIKFQNEMGILESNTHIELLDGIVKNANYLSATINDFRNFALSKEDKELFKIRDSINKTIEIVGAQFLNKDIKIIKKIKDFKLNGHENQLVQVLINILNNSRDELSQMSNDSKKYIFINAYENEENIIIEILDNAGGIDESIIEKVFEPYFTTKHQSLGTGIGLYMSSEIIRKQFGGTIIVKNKKYDYKKDSYFGACFIITIAKKIEQES